VEGKVHLFYQTYGNGPNDAICHAVSDDGLHFTRDTSNPVFHPTGSWTAGRAIDAEVTRFQGKWFLYGATRDPQMKIQMLVGAVSAGGFDRASWKQIGDGPLLKPELPWEQQCIEAPTVVEHNGGLYMFYAGAYNNAPQQIGVARSPDGIHWTRVSDQPLVPVGAPGTWNSSESGHPGAFVDDDGQLYLFYQGNDDKGKTWKLSFVKIAWKGDTPYVMEPEPSARNFDVVVYGGTAGGAVAAVSAAREGLRTALVEPTAHIGGMVSGGLGYTDYGKKEVIGGYALEFYYRVGRYYGMNRFGNDVSWYHEPHAGEKVLRDMLAGAGVQVFTGGRIREKEGVARDGKRVISFTTESGDVFTASVFMDAGYEGDLMAQSGVTWTYGRESTAEYGESLAGVRDRTPLHQFLVDVPARDTAGKLLPEVRGPQRAPAGSADKSVQAYNFRMCFSEAADRVPFAKPEGYDPARYELLARLIAARQKAENRVPPLETLLFIGRLPNGTSDVNNNGAFSTDYIGGSWEYPTASYARRAGIREEHKRYTQGFLYFLGHDPRVPEALRTETARWGLCPHEWEDNGNWTPQLYIRESRRMVGEYVMSQKDLQTDLAKPDVIGMGSYNSDSHNVDRIVDADGFARNEGDMQVAVSPYQIPYRIMTPKRTEVTNLLVPVAFSASHVAYSSVRMEPQYMILGQAAGVAAKMAIAGKAAVQEIDTKALTEKLRADGAVLEYLPSPQARALSKARGAK